MKTIIRALLFDVGGVIINNIDHSPYLAQKSGMSVSKINKLTDRLVPRIERGEMSMEEFYSRISKRIGVPISELDWFGYYKKNFTIDVDITDLIRELHRQYRTGYLTNVNLTEYSYSRKLIGGDLFDYRFASCYLHMRKPEPRIYRYVLKKMKLKPAELIFIDNQPENIKAARKLGIHGIVYNNRRQLDIALSKLLD